MPDFPVPRWPILNVITPFHVESIGMAYRGAIGTMSAGVSAALGANAVVYYPFLVYEPAVAVKMSYLVGGTSNGNADIGIYDSGKNLLVSSGSTAQGTINTLQEFDITDTPLAPGLYFMAMTLSSGTGTVFAVSLADEVLQSLLPMYLETTGGFGLPSTAAFASSTSATPGVVLMGVHFNTLI